MKVELILSPDQAALLAPLWQAATAGGSGHTLAGEVRRIQFPHPDAGVMQLQLVIIPKKTAEAMRKAFVKTQAQAAAKKAKANQSKEPPVGDILRTHARESLTAESMGSTNP